MITNRPVRVLHIIHRLRPGGIQTLVMNVYRKIDRQRVQFDFAVRSSIPDFYEKEIQELGGRIFHLPWQPGNPLSILQFNRHLAHTLRDKGPFAAVHAHAGFYNGFYLPVASKASIPVRIAHSHSTSTAKKNTFIYIAWQYFMRRNIRHSATHRLACSLPAGKWLYGANVQNQFRFKILNNGIDLEPYASLPDKTILRKKLELPEDKLLVGHIGRFDAVKNHVFLINIFEKVLTQNPSAHLILVGEGKLHKQIQTLVEQKGIQNYVHFLGIRQDIPQILGALDFFVLPSVYEGLGIVLIEAQAAGVPCLASDVIPPEADLGLGLLQLANLKEGPQMWAEKLQQLNAESPLSWGRRKTALQKAGYDIEIATQFLQDLYLRHTHLI